MCNSTHSSTMPSLSRRQAKNSTLLLRRFANQTASAAPPVTIAATPSVAVDFCRRRVIIRWLATTFAEGCTYFEGSRNDRAGATSG